VKTDKTQIALGAALLGAFGAFWRWHSPPAKPLTKEEIDHYLDAASKLPLPDGEIEPLIERIRAWAEADDGKPFFNLNVIRYFPENRTWPGAPEFQGTPEEANAYYEKNVVKLLLKRGSYPMIGGKALGQSLMKTLPDQDPWSTVVMVRYRNRRAFLELLADPAYAPYEPYKFMALEIDLVPVSGEMVIPDARWIVGGGLLTLFMAAGWSRAARG